MQTLDDYINAAHHLVPAPQVLPQLLPLLNHADVDSSKVVELISYNQSLTASVLRVCNSAYFSRGTPIDNLQHAVTRIGFRQIHDIVVSVVASVTLARPQKGYGVEAKELWEHSVTAAAAAQLVARDVGEDKQVVFTAAILHDIGKIVLSLALEDVTDKVAFETGKNGLSPIEMETKLLGVNHAEVGGRLLEKWKLPENLIAGVRYHHEPASASAYSRLPACVYVGDFLAYFMGHGYGRHSLDLRARDEALKVLNLAPESMPQYMNETFETLNRIRKVYGLS